MTLDLRPARKKCEHCSGSGVKRVLHRGTGETHGVWCACRHKLPIAFVYQPETSGCCVAAVAMIVGKSYFEVKQLVDINRDLSTTGLSSWEVDSLLDHYGFAVRRRYQNVSRLHIDRDQWPVKPWAKLHFVEVINTRASGQHAVVPLADGRVLDPWWGVLQGLHRYPRVVSMAAVYRVERAAA